MVEATLFGYNAYGFEINPYAALASRVKANSHKTNAIIFDEYIAEFKSFYDEKMNLDYLPQNHPPKGFKTRSPFYSPKVLHKVLIFLDYLALIQATDIRDLFRLAFASTMVSYSNYSYEPSLGRRVSAGKNSVDLIITSPPYLNNYHYNRNTRPHLYWLDFAKQPSDFKNLEYSNFGK